ncbi:phosphate ABC transporter ATP-binding protein PstB [Halobacillus sp. Marseille-P3879]|uniref:phosphate ABC transporter ATP-binding protein PstB n=1 Tax=Halobacillus sp. Marseille-P3879 TaxID=2045014 RepID=UPI000C7D561B|nr:phosphate ABC transporter ATP-binding protein PstB [Halobacillus sp. Marseille-P3879]
MEKHSYQVENLNLWYGSSQALHEVKMDIPSNQVTAIIGPSGCGKSTFLKALNRMVEMVPGVKVAGEIKYNGDDILNANYHPEELRTKVGMVFQHPNPFPKSIYDNVAFGARVKGIRKKAVLDEMVEKSLKRAAIWDEVKDRLNANAMGLSGGQQQRICIARAIANEPDVVLMDEPTSALDPISTLRVEELIQQLKEHYTIVVVTHNMQQASRISDRTAFFLNGEIIEYDKTDQIFSNPKDRRTEDYISGRFG